MRQQLGRVPLLPLLAAALILDGAAVMASQAAPAEPFEEAELFIELNDTDGDLGIHASIDGEAWTALEIRGPGHRLLLDILGRGQLRRQGLTQLFFESAEPRFDELDPTEFFARFPEGQYEVVGRALEGGRMVSTAVLSHVLAAPAANVLVAGVPAAANCDAEPLPTVLAPVTISWDPVTTSHPALGKTGLVTIRRYQFFVEREGVKLSLDLPPTVTQFEIPTGVTDLGNEFKFEIIASTTTGNNTAVESCFRLL